MIDIALSEKLKCIQLLLLDVDGVLTDGNIIFNDDGSESKRFNVKDGLGLKLVMKTGVEVGIITGRKSKALNHRCCDLGIRLLLEGVQDKTKAFDKILEQTGIAADQTAFIGDDLPDLSTHEENSYLVVVASGVDATAILDGFTISGGFADGAAPMNTFGAGVYNVGGSPAIANCNIASAESSLRGYDLTKSSRFFNHCSWTLAKSAFGACISWL